jgi:hypothetical protein
MFTLHGTYRGSRVEVTWNSPDDLAGDAAWIRPFSTA